jgi:hypothetical protein
LPVSAAAETDSQKTGHSAVLKKGAAVIGSILRPIIGNGNCRYY